MARGLLDSKEFDLPETRYVRDIEDGVFQSIVEQTIDGIEGVGLIADNLIGKIVGNETQTRRGITIKQDNRKQAVLIKVAVNVVHGVPIPAKAEEIQAKLAEEIIRLTGIHVESVHVVFKNIVPQVELNPSYSLPNQTIAKAATYSDDF